MEHDRHSLLPGIQGQLETPFNDVAPWAKKCWKESQRGARILLLNQASVGSNWFADYVFGNAYVCFLRPRLSFDGNSPFAKDLTLLAFVPGNTNPHLQCWKWK